MEKISKDRLRECLMEKEYMVLLFSSAMDVNSVLAENALESLFRQSLNRGSGLQSR